MRINAGGGGIAPAPNTTAASGLRTWSSDTASAVDPWVPKTTQRNITIPPEFAAYGLPQKMFQTARQVSRGEGGFRVVVGWAPSLTPGEMVGLGRLGGTGRLGFN